MDGKSRVAQAMASEPYVTERLPHLPVGMYSDGQARWAWPGFIYDAAKGFVDLMHKPAATRATEEDAAAAFNAAGGITTGSIPATMATKVPKNSLTMGIKAYHGSPHDFDKFSLDKIGTGEGAQAYGHGLYFAGHEEVARQYREQLTRGVSTGSGRGRMDVFSVDGVELPASQKQISDIAHMMREYKIDLKTAEGRDWLRREVGARGLPHEAIMQAARLSKQNIDRKTVDGRMYEVDLNVEPNQLLDWDKPLAEQSQAVQDLYFRKAKERGGDPQKLDAAWDDFYENGPSGYSADRFQQMLDEALTFGGYGPNGRGVFDEIAEAAPNTDWSWLTQSSYGIDPNVDTGRSLLSILQTNPQKRPEDVLRDAGIRGIQYLDQGSRAGGEGTRNYVIFDDNDVNILRKYANPATGALPSVATQAAERPRDKVARAMAMQGR